MSKIPSHISVPPKDFRPTTAAERATMRNGKGDMRGKAITVLSEQGRSNWDDIFGKKPRKSP